MDFQKKYFITQKYLTSGSKRRPGLRIAPAVRFIVAHDTGNPDSTAAGNVKYYERSRDEMSASAHIFVDDKDIIECIPALTAAPEKARHVRYNVPTDNKHFGYDANDAAIGVEYCYGKRINADEAYRRYIWVIACACHEFKLDPKTSVVGHFFLDPQRKTDPVTGLAHSRRTYEQLLRDIVDEYNACAGVAPTPQYELVEQAGSVRATVKLNIRKGEPNTKAAVVRPVLPGTSLDYVGWVKNGQNINGNTNWYKNSEGNYFWSGGTDKIISPAAPEIGATVSPNAIGWGLKKLNIPQIWEETKGEGVNVAILDTGIDLEHPELKEAVAAKYNAVAENDLVADSTDGHGTHCAGIIVARGKRVYGVAPASRLYVGKVMNTRNELNEAAFVRGLEWAINNDVQIISMSCGFRNKSEALYEKIKKARQKGIILVAAAGNAGELNIEIDRFPASYEECLSIGSIDENLQRDKISNLSKNLDLLAPGKNILSTFINGDYRLDTGTSMATAFVSGVIALLLSHIKKASLNIDSATVIQIIKETATDYGEIGFDVRSGDGVVNALNAFVKIKGSHT